MSGEETKSGCEGLKERFIALHRRKPNTRYFAGDNTGWQIAFLFCDIAPPWELLDPVTTFNRWRAGNMVFRLFSIEVRPLWMAAELG